MIHQMTLPLIQIVGVGQELIDFRQWLHLFILKDRNLIIREIVNRVTQDDFQLIFNTYVITEKQRVRKIKRWINEYYEDFN